MASSTWNAAAYDRSFARLCAGAVAPLLDAVGDADGRLLDLGTGTGQVAAAASARGWVVSALDADPSMIEHARRRLPGAEVVLGDASCLPWPAAVFDAVTAGFVINHVPDPRAVLTEVRRVLRPGGRVAATIWPATVSPLNAFWNAVMTEAGVGPVAVRLPPDRDFERSPHGLAALLDDAGCRDVVAAEVRWTFEIEPDSLWSAVEGGIATIGAAYIAQSAAGRRRMRLAYDRLGERAVGGALSFDSVAVLGSATC